MSTKHRGRVAPAPQAPDINRFRARHLALTAQNVSTERGIATVAIDEAESPLVWLARRRGRDGRPLIAPHQLQAGERLRRDFTRAQLMPNTTSRWDSPTMRGQTGASDVSAADVTVIARQDVHRALDAVGPDFAGLLLDVCCFLKRLEDVERERVWPARSAKIVLQLALTQLARHYGYGGEATGAARARLRIWLADDAGFSVGD